MIGAIDPGGSGAIAWYDDGVIDVQPMPETRRDTIDAIKFAAGRDASKAVFYHEKINPFIPDGGASQMFEFGRNVERCGCILETLDVRIIEVSPKKWQEWLGIGNKQHVKVPKKGEASPEEIKAAKAFNARAKTEWKNKLKAEAQRRFPSQKVTLKTADALLILDYALAMENKSK